jgi:hypothetical protein
MACRMNWKPPAGGFRLSGREHGRHLPAARAAYSRPGPVTVHAGSPAHPREHGSWAGHRLRYCDHNGDSTTGRSGFSRRVLQVGSQARCVTGPWRHLPRHHDASATDLRGRARVHGHAQQLAPGPGNLRHLRRLGLSPRVADVSRPIVGHGHDHRVIRRKRMTSDIVGPPGRALEAQSPRKVQG